jgi:PAS domain S-box-containing protein
MVLWWGKDLAMLYNDAYRPVLGRTKHPGWLGRPARECWSEIWDVIGPMLEGVLKTGEATWSEDLLLVMDRNIPREEVYFTFSYSPIVLDDGTVGGVFCACTETTERVVRERRLRTLRDLGARAAQAKWAWGACRAATKTLAQDTCDVPFSLFYLADADGKNARLVASTSVKRGGVAAPKALSLTDSDPNAPWPLARVYQTGRGQLLRDLQAKFGSLPGGPWPESSDSALVLPIAASGKDRPVGFLIVGLSPRRIDDAEYRAFFDLVAGHIGTAIANAYAYADERKRAEELAELDRAKTAFFSNVSHEFRTPLTLMLGPAEDAIADVQHPLPLTQLKRIETLHRNGLRLLKLVNTLLDFSRIEAGRIEAVYEPTDLSTLTAELASVFRSATERAGLRLVVDCPPLSEPIFVDQEMWEKIVLNLLSNAFKFTFEGEIGVTLARRGNNVELTLRDTGVGIPQSELHNLFKRFYRVRGTHARTHEGSGIGLALVQELIKLHGGNVRVASVEGEGTTFTVSIPCGSSHLPADQIGKERMLVSTAVGARPYIEEALRWLPNEEQDEPQTPLMEQFPAGFDDFPATVLASREGSTPARVLLADDNADMRDYLKHLLVRYWTVEAVADGEAALQSARLHKPDLVLTDVMMPKLDGFGLLQALRSDTLLREVPIIMLSARAGEESRVEGLEAGADDYLVKPFSARELVARVASHLELRRLRDERRAALRQSEEQGRVLAAIVASSDDAIISKNLDGIIKSWNRGAERIFGYTAEEVVGRHISLLIPLDRQEEETHIIEKLKQGERIDHFETIRVRKDRQLVDVSLTISPIRDESGAIVGISKISRDITEQKRIREMLREANQRKDEFLAMLAHELRSPLASIASAVQLFNSLGPSVPELQKAREIIDRQGRHLTRLVDDLLDVSRIAQGKITLHNERVNLNDAILAAVETSRHLIEGRHHRLDISLINTPVHVEGDATRLAQIFGNLLNNAAKYTEEGGRILVSAEEEGNEVVVRINDNGVGIPVDVLPRIFDLFTQVGRSAECLQGGLGIGLSLVKSLVELHHGTVEAHSTGSGEGSEFVVRLPVAPAEIALIVTNPRERVPINSKHARILVVDDNEDSVESMAVFLELQGHQVRQALDGLSALEVAQTFCPHVVLLDIGLPGMDGFEVARRMRKMPEVKQSVILALSGYGQPEDMSRSQEAGFDDHLVKPVELDTLRAIIASVELPYEEPSDVARPAA